MGSPGVLTDSKDYYYYLTKYVPLIHSCEHLKVKFNFSVVS